MKEERRDVTGGDSFGPGGSNEPSELVNIYIYIFIYCGGMESEERRCAIALVPRKV